MTYLCVLAALLLVTPALSAPWPTLFEPCGTSYDEFEQCAINNIQRAIEKFSGGVEELGIPAFDPMFVPEVLLDYQQQGVEGKMIVKNSRCTGLSKAQVLEFRANLTDPNNIQFDVDFSIPEIFIEGEYKASGKIVAFPISGKGVYNISMKDVNGTWSIRGDLVQQGDEQYLKVRHVGMYPDVGYMKVYASNLFTGSEELNKVALRFANDYWPAFYKELLPFAAQGWDEFLRGMLNKVTLKVPYSTLFPVSK